MAHTSLQLGAFPANHCWLGVVRPGIPARPSRPGVAHIYLWLGATLANHLWHGVASAKLLQHGVPAGTSLHGAAHIYLRLGAALAKLCSLASLPKHHGLAQATHLCVN